MFFQIIIYVATYLHNHKCIECFKVFFKWILIIEVKNHANIETGFSQKVDGMLQNWFPGFVFIKFIWFGNTWNGMSWNLWNSKGEIILLLSPPTGMLFICYTKCEKKVWPNLYVITVLKSLVPEVSIAKI